MKQRGYKIYSCCHRLAINGAWDWSHTPKRAEQRFKNKPWWQNLDLVSALCEANCNGLNDGHKDISTFYPLEHVNDTLHGFPGGSDGNKFCLQRRRCRFNPWVGRIPWRREWLLTPVFLLGEISGQRSLAGYSPWGHKESDTTERLTHSKKYYLMQQATVIKNLAKSLSWIMQALNAIPCPSIRDREIKCRQKKRKDAQRSRYEDAGRGWSGTAITSPAVVIAAVPRNTSEYQAASRS